MALPTQPLDTWALASLLKTSYAPSNWLWDMIENARKNPTPHRVEYAADAPEGWQRFCYVTPDKFYVRLCNGPSDCEWIVPGTLKDTSDL